MLSINPKINKLKITKSTGTTLLFKGKKKLIAKFKLPKTKRVNKGYKSCKRNFELLRILRSSLAFLENSLFIPIPEK